MPRPRVDTIEEAGLAAYEEGGATPAKSMIKAIAVMLAAATQRPSRQTRGVPIPVESLPFGPGAVFDSFEKHCADIIQLRPYETNTFGRLGRNLGLIAGLEVADLERVTAWVQSGGLNGWPAQPTWRHVVNNYANWVAYARAWHAKGGSLASGGLDGSDAWR